jgi:hypothetical protein
LDEVLERDNSRPGHCSRPERLLNCDAKAAAKEQPIQIPGNKEPRSKEIENQPRRKHRRGRGALLLFTKAWPQIITWDAAHG